MPSYLVRQPNGLFAVFSTVVDDFTRYDLTEPEALDWARGLMGEADAREKVGRAVLDEDPWTPGAPSPASDGLYRWRDALDTIRAVHGDTQADGRAALLSAPH